MKKQTRTFKVIATIVGLIILSGIVWGAFERNSTPSEAKSIAEAIIFFLGLIGIVAFIWFSEYADTAITKTKTWYEELDGKRMKKYGTRTVAVLFIIAGIVFIYNRDTGEHSPKKAAGYVSPVIDTVVKEYIVTHTYGRDTLRTELSIYKHRDSIAPGDLTISKVSVEENKKQAKRHKPFWKFWEKSDDESERSLTGSNQSAAKESAASDPNSSTAKIVMIKEEAGKETAKVTMDITVPKSESQFGTQTSPAKSTETKKVYVADDETTTVIRKKSSSQLITGGILSDLKKEE